MQKTLYWLRRAGLKKTANMVLTEIEHTLRSQKLLGKPYYFFIDPCSYCNLRCPLCATGARLHQRPAGMLGLADYQVLLDKIAPFAVTVALHNWGEPLLNPEIFKMIRMTHEKRIHTLLSSNLNVEIEHLGEQIVASGLSHLIVSLDGATQETYEKYRLGGDIELVFENIKKIISARQLSESDTPFVEWQFLVFKHNQHEIQLANDLAERLRVDQFVSRSANFPYDYYSTSNPDRMESDINTWMPSNRRYWDMHPKKFISQGYLWNGACHYLYRAMVVAPGGQVSPCCYDYSNRQDFGNLQQDSLTDIWNSMPYQRSRSLFTATPGVNTGTICEGCFLFKRAPRTGKP